MTIEDRSQTTGHPLTGHPAALDTGHPDRRPLPYPVAGHPVTLTGGHPVTGHPVTPSGHLTGQVTAAPDRGHPVTGHPVTPTGDQGQPDHLKRIPRPLKIAVTVVTWGLSIINGTVAGVGQFEHARRSNVRDWTAFAFPFSMELTAAAFIMLGYQQARRGRSPYFLWAVGASFGLWAVHMQLDGGAAAGRLFAGTTVASLAMWFAKLTGDYKDYLRNADKSGLGLLWIGGFRVARRAVLIKWQLREKVSTTSDLIALANVWNATYDDVVKNPVTDLPLSKKIRRRHAWRITFRAAGVPLPELPGMTNLETVGVSVAPTPEPTPVTPPVSAPVTPTGQVTSPVTAYPPGPFTPVTGHPVTGQAVSRDRRPDRTPAKATAPVSGTPGDGTDMYVRYADYISVVQARIADWNTRDERIPTSELIKVLDAAFLAGELDDKPPTGKATLLKIGWLIETITPRRIDIPDSVWEGDLKKLDREATLAAPLPH